MDQLLVNLKAWLLIRAEDLLRHQVGLSDPAPVLALLSMVISISAIIGAFALLFGLVTVIERKLLGRIQNRYGPNRVGPFGFFQFIADGIKTLTKEDIVPNQAEKLVHFLAPISLVVPLMLIYSVLPIGRNMVALDLDAGLLFFFALGSATELSVFMAGWSSRNKYSMLGAMRAIAQMISYELPLVLSAIAVVMAVGSLSTTAIVQAQEGYCGWLPNWHVFTPWGLAGFVFFFIAATAESNRSPFDLPEGESEIIAGYYIEYSGFKFALFFLGEYFGLFAISGMAITLFLGGWHAPLPFLAFIPSYAWFFTKLMIMILTFIWIRGTLPRLRMDQLMGFAWKFLVPLTLVNLVTVGLWHHLPGPVWRWGVCSALTILSYVGLARALYGANHLRKRTYRFAD